MGNKEKGIRIVRRKTPSEEWNSSHGSKYVYQFWIEAFWHLFKSRWHQYFAYRQQMGYAMYDPTIKVYACRWGQWYNRKQTARKHYHVGWPPREV